MSFVHFSQSHQHKRIFQTFRDRYQLTHSSEKQSDADSEVPFHHRKGKSEKNFIDIDAQIWPVCQ